MYTDPVNQSVGPAVVSTLFLVSCMVFLLVECGGPTAKHCRLRRRRRFIENVPDTQIIEASGPPRLGAMNDREVINVMVEL
jgi:hypothetical protein